MGLSLLEAAVPARCCHTSLHEAKWKMRKLCYLTANNFMMLILTYSNEYSILSVKTKDIYLHTLRQK